MNPLRSGAWSMALVGLVVSTATALAAPDPKAVADSLVVAATAAGGTATYEGAAANGADVVVSNFKLAKRDQTILIPAVLVTKPEARPKGGFTSPRLVLDKGTGSAEGRTFSWESGTVDNAILMTAEEIKARAMIRPFQSVRIGQVAIKDAASGETGSIDSLSGDFGEPVEGAPRQFSLRANTIKVSAAMLAGAPEQKAVVDSLGYKDFTINIAIDGGYDDKSDTLTLTSFAVDTSDVGKLTVSGKFSGMPIGRIAANDDVNKARKTTSGAKLDNLQLRFDNGGLVERIVGMQAQSTGSTRAEIVEQAKAAVGVAFMLTGNADFGDKAAGAVETFLSSPKSITISVAPAAPVSLGKIVDAGLDSWGSLTDLLGLDVKANDQ